MLNRLLALIVVVVFNVYPTELGGYVLMVSLTYVNRGGYSTVVPRGVF